MMRLAVANWALVAILLCGCATSRQVATQQLDIVTDPPGARCVVEHGTEQVGVVEATPGSIQLARTAEPAQVVCSHAGYLEERQSTDVVSDEDLKAHEAAARRRAERSAAEQRSAGSSEIAQAAGMAVAIAAGVAMFAVLLPFASAIDFVGHVGRAVDAAAVDANSEVYAHVLLAPRLVPRVFPDAAARETFFAERREQAEANAALARLLLAYTSCVKADRKSRCDQARARIDEALETRLANLDQQRTRTRVERAPPTQTQDVMTGE